MTFIVFAISIIAILCFGLLALGVFGSAQPPRTTPMPPPCSLELAFRQHREIIEAGAWHVSYRDPAAVPATDGLDFLRETRILTLEDVDSDGFGTCVRFGAPQPDRGYLTFYIDAGHHDEAVQYRGRKVRITVEPIE